MPCPLIAEVLDVARGDLVPLLVATKEELSVRALL